MHQLAKRPSAEQHYLGSAQWGLDRDGVRHGLCRKNRKLEVVAGEESSHIMALLGRFPRGATPSTTSSGASPLCSARSVVSGIEKLAFGLFLAGTVAFFVWVAILAIRK
jgi:hypothetical protein